jgi:hypothetical protein
MFVNPEFQMIRTIEREPKEGRPVMSHLIATGEIVHDPDGVMIALRDRAWQILNEGPRVAADLLIQRKYSIATGFEDAIDIAGIDPARAQSIVGEALIEAAKLYFLMSNRWLPRSKALLTDLDELDPQLSTDFRAAFEAISVDDRVALAAPIIERIAGSRGFFEWDGEPPEVGR